MTDQQARQEVNELEEMMIKALNKGDYDQYLIIRSLVNTLKSTIVYGKA